MSLDVSKLQNVVKSPNGEIQARCPACAAAGADTKGQHLKIFADGKYACAANQGDKAHSKQIYKLAGAPFKKTSSSGKLEVKAFVAPPSEVLVDLASVDRFKRKRHPTDEPVVQAAA